MAEQASSGTMAEASGDTGAHGLDAQTGLSHGLDSQTGLSHVHETHHGRPASWVASSIIIVGFTLGGAAMIPDAACSATPSSSPRQPSIILREMRD